MAENRATSGIDLHLEPARSGGLRRGLTDALRDAVRTGRLAPGTRLPSSRTLAADLGVARNTVADAYGDLVAEGWLTARQGSGTRVADRAVVPPAGSTPPRRREPARPAYNLIPGTPDLAAFPRAEWLKAARRALTAAPSHALDYGDPRGRPELRAALAAYLSRSRGVRADPDAIVVCAGFSHGLRLLARVLRARGVRTTAVESYGLDFHWKLLTDTGLATRPLPYDELGTDTHPLGPAEAVLLTPAHQFPMGVALHPDRRAAVVDWARRTGGLVLEDDYDGEFRYDRQPVGALQGLDPDHVVHLGTASKSLAPGLRLAWMVLPPALAAEVTAAKGGIDTCGVMDQLTLAEFLASGAYDRHVRSSRLRYRRRRDALVAELARRAPAVRATGIAAGMHVVLRLPPGTEQATLRAAAWHGVAVHGLSRYRHPESATEPPDALVVGYGTPPDHTWSGALDALCAALPE
ncbi:PLP-dependent aminotransferase family protein [Streptomyces sp. NPDC020298]|uniref:MocR-like pyridoxine biosynthesis transcription factor PdxR n=1 Tax=unclassified Streptomyces TaxID=2593676 RepID=UPI003404090B